MLHEIMLCVRGLVLGVRDDYVSRIWSFTQVVAS
jgi:hypothetical protein